MLWESNERPPYFFVVLTDNNTSPSHLGVEGSGRVRPVFTFLKASRDRRHSQSETHTHTHTHTQLEMRAGVSGYIVCKPRASHSDSRVCFDNEERDRAGGKGGGK